MPITGRNDGRDARSHLTNTEHPNNLFRKVALLARRSPFRAIGRTPSGLPDLQEDKPLIVSATPSAVWLGDRFELSIEVELAYSPEPTYVGLNTEVAATAGHLGYDQVVPNTDRPFSETYTLSDIGLVEGATYMLRVQVLDSVKGAGEWTDWYTGINFNVSGLDPDPPTLAPSLEAFGVFPYRYIRPGAEFAVGITPPSDPPPDEYIIQYYPASVDPDVNPELTKSRTATANQSTRQLDGIDIEVPMRARAKSRQGAYWSNDWSDELEFEIPPPEQPPAPSPVELVEYGQHAASVRMEFEPHEDTPEPLYWNVKTYKEGVPSQYYALTIPGSAGEFTFPEVVEVDVNYKYLVIAIVMLMSGEHLAVPGVEATYKAPLPSAPNTLVVDTDFNSPSGYATDTDTTMSLGVEWTLPPGGKLPAQFLVKAVPGFLTSMAAATNYPGQIVHTQRGNDLNAVINGLTMGNTYTVGVFAVGGGKYSSSSPLLAWTVPIAPPLYGGPRNPGFEEEKPGQPSKAHHWEFIQAVPAQTSTGIAGGHSERRTGDGLAYSGESYYSGSSPYPYHTNALSIRSEPFAVRPGDVILVEVWAQNPNLAAGIDNTRLDIGMNTYAAGTPVSFGAEARAIIQGGVVTDIVMDAAGEGYATGAAVTVRYHGSGAAPTVDSAGPTVVNGRVTDIPLLSGGSSVEWAQFLISPTSTQLTTPKRLINADADSGTKWLLTKAEGWQKYQAIFGPLPANAGLATLVISSQAAAVGTTSQVVNVRIDSVRYLNITETGFVPDLTTSTKSTLTGALSEAYDTQHAAVQVVTNAGLTIATADQKGYYPVTTGNTNRTVNLPDAALVSGKILTIEKVDSGTGTVTIDANGSQTINGALTYVLNAQWWSVTVISDGSNWHILASDRQRVDELILPKYVTTEAHSTLSNELVIPGLGGNIIRAGAPPPAGVSGGISEEYDTASHGLSWTLNTPTTHNSNATLPSHLFIETATVASYIGARNWIAGSGAKNAWAHLGLGVDHGSSATSNYFGLLVADATFANRIVMNLEMRPSLKKWQVSAWQYTGGTWTQVGTSWDCSGEIFAWISRGASNDWYFRWSERGTAWQLVGSTVLAFTIARVGYWMDIYQASTTRMISDFLRTDVV